MNQPRKGRTVPTFKNEMFITVQRIQLRGVDREESHMLDKSKIDGELARRLCAAFMSRQLGVTIATQYKNTPEDVGDLWYFIAALADKLARENQEVLLKNIGRLATELIQ
jgi:hypothetical protein